MNGLEAKELARVIFDNTGDDLQAQRIFDALNSERFGYRFLINRDGPTAETVWSAWELIGWGGASWRYAGDFINAFAIFCVVVACTLAGWAPFWFWLVAVVADFARWMLAAFREVVLLQGKLRP